jgi:hypothetical protein
MKKPVVLLFALSIALAAADSPRIFYAKDFPGTRTPHMEILLERSGDAEYREAADDDRPLKLKLTPEETETVFSLAAKLDCFQRPLESNLKVARVGNKTYRWIEGERKHEVQFNYSVDVNAQELQTWFERLTDTAFHYYNLERAVKFDKLGVNGAILYLQTAYDQGRLVSLPVFLPLLNRIIDNDSYLNIARERAAVLRAAFTKPGKVKAE